VDSVRERVVTSVILAWPAITEKVCALQDSVTLPNASVVVEWTSPSSVALFKRPTVRDARLAGLSGT
jgi:hypothetical protein